MDVEEGVLLGSKTPPPGGPPTPPRIGTEQRRRENPDAERVESEVDR
jgi:hypothetical protein